MEPGSGMLKGMRAILCRLLRLEWVALGLVSPFLLFPTVRPRWTMMALAFLVLWWLTRWVVCSEAWPVTPFNVALVLFGIMVTVGTAISSTPVFTIPKVSGLLLGLAVFRALALSVQRERDLALAVWAFMLLGLAILTAGLFGALWSYYKIPQLKGIVERIPRLFSELPELHAKAISPNQLAGVLAFYFPFTLALTFEGVGRKRNFLRSVASLSAKALYLLLIGGVLLLTQSRSGWIGAFAGLVTLFSLAALTHRVRRVRWVGIALPVLVLLTVAGFLMHIGPQRFGEILYGAGTNASVEEVLGEITIAGRVEIWSRALYAIQDFAFTGCGLGGFREIAWVLYPLFSIPPGTDFAHAHNIFLQTALDLGIPGLMAYLALLMVAGAICWQVARKNEPFVRPLAIGLIAGLLALHAYGMTDALALGSKPGIVFWFALGLLAALERAADSSSGGL